MKRHIIIILSVVLFTLSTVAIAGGPIIQPDRPTPCSSWMGICGARCDLENNGGCQCTEDDRWGCINDLHMCQETWPHECCKDFPPPGNLF
jgi:hypothetical protein